MIRLAGRILWSLSVQIGAGIVIAALCLDMRAAEKARKPRGQ